MEKTLIEQINKWWESKDFRYNVIDRPSYMRQMSETSSKLIDILMLSPILKIVSNVCNSYMPIDINYRILYNLFINLI